MTTKEDPSNSHQGTVWANIALQKLFHHYFILFAFPLTSPYSVRLLLKVEPPELQQYFISRCSMTLYKNLLIFSSILLTSLIEPHETTHHISSAQLLHVAMATTLCSIENTSIITESYTC